MRIYLLLSVFALAGLMASGCTMDDRKQARSAQANPIPERYEVSGQPCAHCHLEVASSRHGGQLTTAAGETLTFASAECMARYVSGDSPAASSVKAILVADYVHGNRLLPVDNARFLHSRNVDSPGGVGLVAFQNDEDLAYNMRFSLDGQVLTWDQVVELVANLPLP
jgi:hypothetical protein